MIKINTPLEIKNCNILKLDEIYFVYQYNKLLKNIKPETYDSISKKFGTNLCRKIIDYDDVIRSESSKHKKTTSYVHADIAGFSNVLSFNELFNTEYITYYFKLTRTEINDCLFYLKDKEGVVNSLGKGFGSLANVIKKFSIDSEKYSSACVSIPFKVKPLFYLPPANKRTYYHGSTKKIEELKPWTYVTPYKEDAISFAVPWSSSDLVYTEHETSIAEGRPPGHLCFKSTVKKPRDRKIYVYSLNDCETISTKTNTGKEYPWNRITTKKQTNLKTEVIKSWKKQFKLK